MQEKELEIFRLSVDKNRRQKGTAAKLIDRINQVYSTYISLHRKLNQNKWFSHLFAISIVALFCHFICKVFLLYLPIYFCYGVWILVEYFIYNVYNGRG
jgi:hypothetical protein